MLHAMCSGTCYFLLLLKMIVVTTLTLALPGRWTVHLRDTFTFWCGRLYRQNIPLHATTDVEPGRTITHDLLTYPRVVMAEDFRSFVVLFKTVPSWPRKEFLWPEQVNCSGVVCVPTSEQRATAIRFRSREEQMWNWASGACEKWKSERKSDFQWEDGEVYGASREKCARGECA